MLTLLLAGSLWFWLLIVLETILLLALIEYEQTGWSTLSLIATFVGLKFIAGINVLTLAWHHPGTAGLFIAGYFAAGTVWSIIKWYLFVRKFRERYEAAKADFKPNALHMDEQVWNKSYRYRAFLNSKGTLPPLVRDNKSRIMLWMTYWPWSALWTIINDPIKRIFRAIYNRIHDALQAISNRQFKDVE